MSIGYHAEKQVDTSQTMRLLFLSFALLLTIMAASGCSRDSHDGTVRDKPAAPAVDAAIMSARQRAIPSEYEAVGSVKSYKTVTVSARISGFITSLNFNEGDRVTQGQIVAVISAPELDAKVSQAQAAIDEANDALVESENAISSAEASIDSAATALKLAENTLKRYESLIAADSVSRQEYDEVAAKRDLAAAELRRAKNMRDAAAARKKQVMSRIAQARAVARETEAFKNYTVLRAPISGVVSDKPAEAGDLLSPGMAVLRIESDARYRIEVPVDESRIASVYPGLVVTAMIDAAGGAVLKGKVDEISPQGDSSSHTFIVKVSLPISKGIKSGMFGRVKFPMQSVTGLYVPNAAVVHNGAMEGVFIAGTDGKVHLRTVKTGRRSDGNVEIISGLDAGERIALPVSGPLTDGAMIRRQDER